MRSLDEMAVEFAPPGSVTSKRRRAVQAAMLSLLEAADRKANSEESGCGSRAVCLTDCALP